MADAKDEATVAATTGKETEVKKPVVAATTGKEKEKMLTLVANDGEVFEVEESVAALSRTIKNMMEDGCADNAIPIPNVSSRILSLVLEFCRAHAKDGEASSQPKETSVDDLKTFDAKFVDVDQATLFELILAANYLDIKVLLDLTCQAVADMVKGKSVEEIRAIFGIVNDFTPEEEAEVKRKHKWAFE